MRCDWPCCMDLAVFIRAFLDFILHIDTHLAQLIAQYGPATYLLLFIIIFCETGLVFTPFLPGDSLLFAAGAFAAIGAFNAALLFAVLAAAAIIGDNLNYFIGRNVGVALFRKFPGILRREYLTRTETFYEKHGKKTVILARFFPIIRTFSPFVAGLGRMRYRLFLLFDVIGALLWVGLFVFAGYFFGNIPFIKNNFTLVIMAIIILSMIPAILQIVQHALNARRDPKRAKTRHAPRHRTS